LGVRYPKDDGSASRLPPTFWKKGGAAREGERTRRAVSTGKAVKTVGLCTSLELRSVTCHREAAELAKDRGEKSKVEKKNGPPRSVIGNRSIGVRVTRGKTWGDRTQTGLIDQGLETPKNSEENAAHSVVIPL